MYETSTHCRIQEVTPVANKVQRAQSIVGRMAMKKVFFPKVSPWSGKAVDEVLKFPNSRHDDFVDTLSWIGMGLGELRSPHGIKANSNFPKTGTMAWIKWDAQIRQRELSLSQTSGW
jgi:hypothetical protein